MQLLSLCSTLRVLVASLRGSCASGLCRVLQAAKLPSFTGSYQGKFGQASFNTDDQHTVEEANHPSGMPATHITSDAPCAYQGRFGTTPAAKMFEPQHSGELERKGSAYHGHFGQ